MNANFPSQCTCIADLSVTRGFVYLVWSLADFYQSSPNNINFPFSSRKLQNWSNTDDLLILCLDEQAD
ncbi:hypothetical protein WKK05_23645 [Nostoc sp. UHCC 0302]|uniref:hypothetical protein n=1 Tax=Nostoc sp. UHCC 0302 TaxID=3134896 RepID=UPI00311CA49F